MTKCHLTVFVLTMMLISACGGQKGQSLSEYASRSISYRMEMFAKYAAELFAMTPQEAQAKQDSTMRAAGTDSASLRSMLALQDHFLNDVNSPYRCEDFYIPVLRAIISSPFTCESEKTAAAEDLKNYSLNRLGEAAADFSFTLKNGRTRTLYSVRADYTILFFSNPGCQNCKEIMQQLSTLQHIDFLTAEGKLAIVNIYPDDDLDAWFGYVAEYPDAWTNGYAPDVDEPGDPQLYYVRAIPTLYLLDRDKKVLMKDAPLERILQYLELK